MKLQDCDLNPVGVSTAPLVRKAPEDTWTRAKDQGSIPLSLFELYRRADYLSFGSAPSFLKDRDNILFSYFGVMVRGIASSLIDADTDSKEFLAAQKETYYPGKNFDDPSWTRQKSETAAKRANRAFGSLLMSLQASLDSLAEVVAIFSQGTIRKLKVGRAQFYSIEEWLETDQSQPNLIAAPRELYLADLHAKLRPIIHCGPPETDWLPYMRMLRNKAAHLGDASFRSPCLPGNDGRFYTFIPREWPYLWEKYVKPKNQQQPTPIRDLVLKTLVQQDICEYARGALGKVREVISEACKPTAIAYAQFSDFEFNQTALDQLTNNFEDFAFERFV